MMPTRFISAMAWRPRSERPPCSQTSSRSPVLESGLHSSVQVGVPSLSPSKHNVPSTQLSTEQSPPSATVPRSALREGELCFPLVPRIKRRAPELARRATGVFSAKEAFYKAQYPTTETFLGFMDVRLTYEAQPQRVTVRVVRPGSPLLGLQLSGFLVEVDAWVASGVFGECQTVDVDR